jgi:hypothetical protein
MCKFPASKEQFTLLLRFLKIQFQGLAIRMKKDLCLRNNLAAPPKKKYVYTR